MTNISNNEFQERQRWIAQALAPIGINPDSREGRMLAIEFGVLMDRLDEFREKWDSSFG